MVASVVLYLALGLLFMPREGKSQAVAAPGDGTAVTPGDPLSYAIGVIVAREIPLVMDDWDLSDAEKEFFVKGVCDAIPADDSPEAIAYAKGVIEGAIATEELAKIEKAVHSSDPAMKINKGKLHEGIRAMATNENLEMSYLQAIEYYNTVLFRKPSEDFIENIKSRGGVEVLASGVPVKIESQGNGEMPALDSTIGYIYKASFINGMVFDSSHGEVVEANVSTLLPGLIDAVTSLPVGTKCKVYLPWYKAYGERGGDRVPPYSAIVYDIEIVKIVKK